MSECGNGDAHPAADAACVAADSDATDEQDDSDETQEVEDAPSIDGNDATDEGDDSDDAQKDDAQTPAPCAVQAIECRATLMRHDDWLHRGPYLADMPWYIHMMRVRRARKPYKTDADCSQLCLFDVHCPLSVLYCQEIRYHFTAAIPRMVGSQCPDPEEDAGEPHAAYKLMLFSRTRCIGTGHCADPLMFRSHLLPSDKPDTDIAVEQDSSPNLAGKRVGTKQS